MRKIKFIIFGGEIIIGTTEFHRQLIPAKHPQIARVAGGGEIKVNKDGKTIAFEGYSIDFGMADPDATKYLFERNRMNILNTLEMITENMYGIDDLKDYEVWIYGKKLQYNLLNFS